MTAAASASGVLFPDVPALVAREDDGYVLLDGSGLRSRVRGPICADIGASLSAGESTPGLRRLAAAHPVLELLQGWLATRAVPLTKLDALRLDGFDTLFVELLGRCNERCVHCYADAAPTVEEALERDVVFSIIDQAAALGFRRIQFTGGDPLLCSFLPDAVAHARRAGLSHIEIFTNGLALTDELLAELAPHAPAFAFSFYNLDPERHDAVTRTPGSQRRTLAAIDRVIARGLESRVAIVALSADTDVQAIVEFLRARGVGFVSWTRTYSVGRGSELESEVPVAQTGNLNLAEGGGHRAAGTHAGNGKLCITYNGDVVPCIFNRNAMLGNVATGQSLVDIIAGGRARAKRLQILGDDAPKRLQCASCRFTELALDWLGAA